MLFFILLNFLLDLMKDTIEYFLTHSSIKSILLKPQFSFHHMMPIDHWTFINFYLCLLLLFQVVVLSELENDYWSIFYFPLLTISSYNRWLSIKFFKLLSNCFYWTSCNILSYKSKRWLRSYFFYFFIGSISLIA